jgi:hypothetical protein
MAFFYWRAGRLTAGFVIRRAQSSTTACTAHTCPSTPRPRSGPARGGHASLALPTVKRFCADAAGASQPNTAVFRPGQFPDATGATVNHWEKYGPDEQIALPKHMVLAAGRAALLMHPVHSTLERYGGRGGGGHGSGLTAPRRRVVRAEGHAGHRLHLRDGRPDRGARRGGGGSCSPRPSHPADV